MSFPYHNFSAWSKTLAHVACPWRGTSQKTIVSRAQLYRTFIASASRISIIRESSGIRSKRKAENDEVLRGTVAAPVAVREGRSRIEVHRPYFSGEDSLASNKAGAFLL
jgi:hypothetical protein